MQAGASPLGRLSRGAEGDRLALRFATATAPVRVQPQPRGSTCIRLCCITAHNSHVAVSAKGLLRTAPGRPLLLPLLPLPDRLAWGVWEPRRANVYLLVSASPLACWSTWRPSARLQARQKILSIPVTRHLLQVDSGRLVSRQEASADLEDANLAAKSPGIRQDAPGCCSADRRSQTARGSAHR